MQEQALNFATQAIESLSAQSKYFEQSFPLTARNIQNIVSLLQVAVKFYLPDNGRLFDDNLRALPAVFRLPYPVIAAEFRITKYAPAAHQPILHSGDAVQESSRRIALAVEINHRNFEQFSWMLPPIRRHLLDADGAIAIIPVYYNDKEQRWQIPPFGSLTPNRKVDANPEALARSTAIFGGNFPKGVTPSPLEVYLTYLMPEYCAELEKENDVNYVFTVMSQDTADELAAVMGLVEILSCNNVTTATVAPPKMLNKKRISKGRPPFFEYKVLMLDHLGEAPTVSSPQAGSHASPRVHLRRGHIRRLPERSIWVNAAVVGNKQAGLIVKDYAVKNIQTPKGEG